MTTEAQAEAVTTEGAPRAGQDLIWATRPFAVEQRARSWLYVVSTLGLIAATLAATALAPWLALKAVLSFVAGLLVVRGFILFHDFQHNALLRGSKLAKPLFGLYGLLVLTPPTVWRATHNYHHAHTAKIVGSHVGSYMMLTVDLYKKATPLQRWVYRTIRHPANITIGYLTIFLWGMCMAPFLRSPKKHTDGLVAFVLHVGLSVAVYWLFGWQAGLFLVTIPIAVACALGGYLFYAQHNFPEMHVQPRESWEYTRAALESSSYMEFGPLGNFLTGNIGYHHVHHLNPAIPFYRLPETMAALPELQHPGKTSLWPKDVLACLHLKLWDPEQGKMVGYPE